VVGYAFDMEALSDPFRIRYPRPLIVAAVARELHEFGVRAPAIGDWRVRTILDGVAVVVSGVGRSAAAGAVAWNLAQRSYNCVLSVGVAGALPASGLEVGDVVAGSEAVFHEEGLITPEGHQSMAALGFPLTDGDEVTNRVAADPLLLRYLTDVCDRVGPIATVAGCSGTDAAASEVEHRTGACAEAMEGAAVLATARRLGVPAAELRVISNTTGDRPAQRWDLDSAVERLATALRDLLALPEI
jgi:futalosine hydrolase